MKTNHDKSLSEIWARFVAQPNRRDIAGRMGRMAPYAHSEQSQSCYNLGATLHSQQQMQFGGPECQESSSSLLLPHPWDRARKKEHEIAALG